MARLVGPSHFIQPAELLMGLMLLVVSAKGGERRGGVGRNKNTTRLFYKVSILKALKENVELCLPSFSPHPFNLYQLSFLLCVTHCSDRISWDLVI